MPSLIRTHTTHHTLTTNNTTQHTHTHTHTHVPLHLFLIASSTGNLGTANTIGSSSMTCSDYTIETQFSTCLWISETELQLNYASPNFFTTNIASAAQFNAGSINGAGPSLSSLFASRARLLLFASLVVALASCCLVGECLLVCSCRLQGSVSWRCVQIQ